MYILQHGADDVEIAGKIQAVLPSNATIIAAAGGMPLLITGQGKGYQF